MPDVASLPDLVCPSDHAPLSDAPPSDGASGLRCPECQREFPVERSVVRCMDASDEFYEGRYLNTINFVPRNERFWWSWPLWLINSGYVWKVRQHVPAGGIVVEVGCASGIAYYASRYSVVGVDLSFSSLAQVAGLYHRVVQADLVEGIPLPDGSVDAIVSSYVWEHIPPEIKPRALEECARILRPGGKLVFLYDVESDNPVYRRMKTRDPALYQEVLIDREGHLGWESADDNSGHFRAAGFHEIETRGKEKLFFSPMMYDKVKEWGGGLERLGDLGLKLTHGLVFQLYNAFIRAFDESIGRMLPRSWSRVAVSVCEKPAISKG